MADFDTKREDAKLAEAREREEEDIAHILSEKYGMTYTDLSLLPINTDALRVIPEEKAREAEAAAFDRTAKNLSLAIRNPNNVALADVLTELSARGFTVKKFLVSERSIAKAFARYVDLSFAAESKVGVFDISGAELEKLSLELSSVGALRNYLDTLIKEKRGGGTSRLLEVILAGGFALKASDIHVEPEENEVRLRLRLDGLLVDVTGFDEHTSRSLASRIKLLSGMKLNVSNRAQDGRFSVVVKGSEIEIRSSVIPGNYGESFVLRLLDPASLSVGFDELGIHPKLLARLAEEIKRPNGMLLTTGPTGSGKTTTLYTFLRTIQRPDIKIITIEDPIEYHLPGVVQTQVDEKSYTFALGLRSIVRQDPDVIMVGEIRDGDTANIAIEAALTGHFVFSTLHTNDAAGTFPRLVDLDADPKSFASAITVTMAQRLVRRLDPNARHERALKDSEKKQIEKILATIEDKSLLPKKIETTWEPAPAGSPASAEETGYKGRIGLYEAIFMDEKLGKFLRDNPASSDIAHEAKRQGYLTMTQDGVLKALAGITSLAEVFSVVDLPLE